jgi:CheY-like chemotaxis protein
MTDVLVVDDAPDVRLLLRTVLSHAGCQVTEASGGREAVSMLRNALPDLVLLDVQMPDDDGWQTLAAIRADPHTADLPVVLCTVKGGVDDQQHGWRLGCDGFVAKPFAIPDLVDTISAVVARSPDERLALRTTYIKGDVR